MKRSVFILVAALALGSVVVLYFVWWLPRDADPGPGKQPTTEEKERPFKPFLPAGWTIGNIKEEVLERIDIPHLHKKLVGQKVRVADIQGKEIVFAAGKASEYRNQHLTKGRVILLAETGQIVRVELFEASAERVRGQLTLDEADDHYNRTSETYEALAKESPVTSFAEVLDTVGTRSMGDVHQSRRVEASYLVYSREGISEPQVVWTVTCYGFPTGRIRVSRLRHLLNAEGQLLTVSSSP